VEMETQLYRQPQKCRVEETKYINPLVMLFLAERYTARLHC